LAVVRPKLNLVYAAGESADRLDGRPLGPFVRGFLAADNKIRLKIDGTTRIIGRIRAEAAF
jgi:hypothetical protein